MMAWYCLWDVLWNLGLTTSLLLLFFLLPASLSSPPTFPLSHLCQFLAYCEWRGGNSAHFIWSNFPFEKSHGLCPLPLPSVADPHPCLSLQTNGSNPLFRLPGTHCKVFTSVCVPLKTPSWDRQEGSAGESPCHHA